MSLDPLKPCTDPELLCQRIASLEAEVARLLLIVNSHASNTEKGKLAEDYIARLIDCTAAPHGAEYDLQQVSGELRFEVKFSCLRKPNRDATTRRWEWSSVFGSTREKSYNRLILVGETDPNFSYRCSDRNSPYVLFDVPFSDVSSLANKFMTIKTITNSNGRKRAEDIRLFTKYQVSVQVLKQRYARMAV